jgi:BirA family biotin operon repressor/biotin-[acetyl-CoA-carboxylase] ligase
MSGDLTPEALAPELAGRPFRAYPALLSTEPEAMAWARSGGPAGAVVVADYQAAPRGRGGWPWQVRPGRGLGFSLLLRPDLPPEREGWLYVVASVALADELGDVRVDWPETVTTPDGGTVLARLGIAAHLGPARTEWAVATVLVEAAEPPRGALLARLAAAVEARLTDPAELVVEAYRRRCATLGRLVRARMIPLGPGGPVIAGEAVDVSTDGALVLRTARDVRVAVRAPHLGLLELGEEAGSEGHQPPIDPGGRTTGGVRPRRFGNVAL